MAKFFEITDSEIITGEDGSQELRLTYDTPPLPGQKGAHVQYHGIPLGALEERMVLYGLGTLEEAAHMCVLEAYSPEGGFGGPVPKEARARAREQVPVTGRIAALDRTPKLNHEQRAEIEQRLRDRGGDLDLYR